MTNKSPSFYNVKNLKSFCFYYKKEENMEQVMVRYYGLYANAHNRSSHLSKMLGDHANCFLY